MILTCPECASRYAVDDARVGPRGRLVRCASCGHSWRAGAGDALDALEAAPALAVSLLTVQGETASGRAQPLPKLIRQEALEKRKTREAIAAGVAWAALAAAFVALVLAAILFRVDVVRLWPKTASAYALARMPVNPTGLNLDNVQGQTTLINGHAALTVTGAERNIESGARPSMPIRVILFDKAGRRLASSVSAPPTVSLGSGDSRPFALNFLDPASDLSSFQVEFAFDKIPTPRQTPSLRQPGRAGAPASGVRPLLRAAAARPLLPGSPYALPPAALQQPTPH